jgi:hypothetical protein
MATSTRQSYDTDIDPTDPIVKNERTSVPPADLGRRLAPATGMNTGWIVLAVIALVIAAVLIIYSNSARVTTPAASNDTNVTQPAPALPDATETPQPGATGTPPAGSTETSPTMTQPPAATQPAPALPTPTPSETQQ